MHTILTDRESAGSEGQECGKEGKRNAQTGWNGWRKASSAMCDRSVGKNETSGGWSGGVDGELLVGRNT